MTLGDSPGDGAPSLGKAATATRVIISEGAWRKILAEVTRHAEMGLRQHGSPFESIVYPLSAMVPARQLKGELRCPVELAGLHDIGVLVIADAIAPPEDAKAFSPMNCHFESQDGTSLAEINSAFNRQIDERLAHAPRLGVLSKLHSHPFLGGNFLSGGDLGYNVYAPGAVAWRERRGLGSALMHVVNPRRSPSLGANGGLVDCEWQLSSWGLGSDGVTMNPLQPCEHVEDEHPLIRKALQPPYYATPAGAAWCEGQKQALRERGFTVSRNLLPRGWRRYLLGLPGRDVLLALPPDTPGPPLRILEVKDAARNLFVPIELPPKLRLWGGDFSRLSLVAIANHLAGRKRASARSPRRAANALVSPR